VFGVLVRDVSTYFRALADRKRLHIVESLARIERMTVTQLSEEMRLSQPLVSWHLRILRKAGIVKTRRSGRQVWCSLDRASLAEYQRETAQLFGLPEIGDSAQESPLVLESVRKR
jgi:DNA-binding transcriptional ArsR family regulator